MRLSTRKPESPACPQELKTLGDHLRKRRLELGLRQIDVAQQLGVAIQCISNWEHHRSSPKVYLIPRIVEFLGYSPFERPNNFPETLRAHRRAAGLSQERLAELTGIDESSLTKWERGETMPFPATAERLRRFFSKMGQPLPEFRLETFYGPERRAEAARRGWRTKKSCVPRHRAHLDRP